MAKRERKRMKQENERNIATRKGPEKRESIDEEKKHEKTNTLKKRNKKKR